MTQRNNSAANGARLAPDAPTIAVQDIAIAADTESIWRALAEPLRRFIVSRVANDADADDILQDVFVRIHARIETLRDGERLQSWVYQIARNAIGDYYRKSGRIDELPDTLPANEGDDDAIERAMMRSMKNFIELLPDGYREAIELEAVGVPQKIIAERQGLSLSGAKSRVQRGRAMVKEMLEACCEYQFDRYGKVIDYRRRQPQCCPEC